MRVRDLTYVLDKDETVFKHWLHDVRTIAKFTTWVRLNSILQAPRVGSCLIHLSSYVRLASEILRVTVFCDQTRR
jgi:hypothetical protein